MTPDPTQNRPMTTTRHMELVVGQNEGDLIGADDKILQAAVDYLSRLGGGTVKILPGTYSMRNALYLRSGISIKGSGEDTILKKAPGSTSDLIQEADWYEARVRVENVERFTVGCGIMLR